MKTKEQYQLFADELKALCDKHNIDVIGTCFTEGTLGEIQFTDRDVLDLEVVPNYEVESLRFGQITDEYCIRAKRKE